MYKIAVLDDDENWCFALQRFFRNYFEVSVFKRVTSFLTELNDYDLVIVDFSIPPAAYEKDMDGCQVICYLKENLPNPPILILATGFISKSNLELGSEICPQADAFFAKDAGLEEILQQTQQLLSLKKELRKKQK